MPTLPWIQPATRTVNLPAFGDDEGNLVRAVQDAIDRSELADPMDGFLAGESLFLSTDDDARGRLAAGGVGVAVNTALVLNPSYAALERQRRTLILQRRSQHLPVAWAASTAVYRQGDRYVSNTQVTARREADFHQLALRTQAPQLTKVYEQYLYVVGTQAAVDETFVGDPAERAACRARLGCLLGATGGQLEATYRDLTRPSLTGLKAASIAFNVAALALFVPATLGLIIARPQTDAGRRLGGEVALGALAAALLLAAATGLYAYARRRPEHHHIEAFARVRATHAALLGQASLAPDALRDALMVLRDEVARKSHVSKVAQAPGSLPLLPIGQQAMDELYAYWLPEVAPALAHASRPGAQSPLSSDGASGRATYEASDEASASPASSVTEDGEGAARARAFEAALQLV